MSMIGYENWAVDLKDVGAIYPMQGLEVPMVIAGIIFWLAWHRIQYKEENAHLEAAKASVDVKEAKKAIGRY